MARVPTITGTLLFVFIVLSLARRRVFHVNVTNGLSALYAASASIT